MRLDTILAPTDFSETADHALVQAIALAKRFDATLHVFHVVEPYATPPPHMMVAVRDYLDKLERDAKEMLAEKAEAIRALGVDVSSTSTHHVAPYEAIHEKASALEPDLIVLGTHGRRGFKRLILGSVAEKVLRTAPTNVLTLSLEAKLGTNDEWFRRILVAVDFSDPSKRALNAGFSMLDEDGALSVVHVYPSPVYPSFYPAGIHGPVRVDTELPDSIREHVDRWLDGRDAELVIREGDAGQEILDVCDESAAGLIVMGTRGLTGLSHVLLGSVAEKVARRAKVPVLTIH